jgi:putative flippase GtrA
MLHCGSRVATLYEKDKFMAAQKKKQSGEKIIKQGAKFSLVGLSNAVIDFSLYTGLSALLAVPLDKVYLVKYFSGSVAMCNSFYWNRKWTFKSKAGIGRSGFRFLVATLTSVWGIQPGVVWLFTATWWGQAFGTFWFNLGKTVGVVGLMPETLTLPLVIKTVAFGMGVLTIFFWDFILYKLWAFKDD